jgi:anthranilate synthase component 2
MPAPRLLVLDNYDSFTFTLVDYLRSAGAEVEVVRNDVATASALLKQRNDGVLISPGPGRPEDAGVSVDMAKHCMAQRRPLLGVCLGHQAIALACGQAVARVAPMHGKIAAVRHDSTGLFAGLPSPIAQTRYHSLAVSDPEPPLIANAWSEDGTVMAMRHADAPAHGVQFHPESIASDHGREIVAAFVRSCA